MVEKRNAAQVIGNILNIVFLSLLAFVMLYPLLYVIFVSLSDPIQVLGFRGIMWRPLGFDLTSYRIVLSNSDIGSGYLNTMFVLVIGLAFNIVLTSFGAYFLSRKNVLFFKPIMILILITMYFSGGLIPTWLTVKDLGLYDSLWRLSCRRQSALTT